MLDGMLRIVQLNVGSLVDELPELGLHWAFGGGPFGEHLWHDP